MRFFSTALVAALLTNSPIQAQDAISPETLAAVKNASVFIRLSSNDGESSGSGFVIKSDNREIHVATNHHVVADARKRVGAATITVVFGSGTPNEQSARGEIIAFDPEIDLAVVKVPSFPNFPKPLEIMHSTEPVETMQLYTFGFPLGRILDQRSKNPAITVSRGSVSSLRRDPKGKVEKIQIDGALNHGNSGGPLVDAKGRLIGIAVQTVNPNVAQQIGLAIPREDLLRVLDGYAGAFSLRPTSTGNTSASFEAEIILVDPWDKIRSVSLLTLPVTAANRSLGGEAVALPGATSQSLTTAGRKALGNVKLTSVTPADRRAWIQVATVDTKGVSSYSKPIMMTLSGNRATSLYDLRTGRGMVVAQETPQAPRRRNFDPAAPEEQKGMIAPFYTAVFSGKRKVAITLDRDGIARAYDIGTFALKGTARLSGPAAHAALDGEAGLLYAYVAVDGFLRFDANRDNSPHGLADLHVYDVKALLESKEDDDKIDDLVPVSTFPRNANAQGMSISASGKYIFALEREKDDESGGPAKLIRISTADKKPEMELEVAPGTMTFCLTPDGRTIYAGARVEGQGLLQVVESSSFELRRTLKIQSEPCDIEATNLGFVLIACRGGQIQVAEMVKAKGIVGSWYASGLEPAIRLAPDQRRVYTGEQKNFIARTIQSWALTGQSSSQMATRTGTLSAQGQNSPSLAGELFLVPDGQALLTRAGAVIPLGSKKFGPTTVKPKKIEDPAAPAVKPKPIP